MIPLDIQEAKYHPPKAEKLVLPKYTRAVNPSLEEARKLAESQGNWREAYSYFRTLREDSSDPQTRKTALVRESQMLINLGLIDDAAGVLDHHQAGIINSLKSRADQGSAEMEILVQQAWIADLRNQFQFSKNACVEVRSRVDPNRSDDEMSAFWTATHFLGRANLGLAIRTHQPRSYRDAEYFFNEDLSRLDQLRSQGQVYPLNIAFLHSWLTLTALAQGQFSKADDGHFRAQSWFNTAALDSNQPHIKEQAKQLTAQLELGRGYLDWFGEESLTDIAKNLVDSFWASHGQSNRVGSAESAWLLGRSMLQGGETKLGNSWFDHAQAIYPHIAERPFVNI